MRARLCGVVLGAGLVLWALARPAAYDFARYEVISGYDASQWTWVLVAIAAMLAVVALVRPPLARWAARGNLAAVVILAATIAWTVDGVAARPQPDKPPPMNCGNVDFKALCRLSRALGSPYRDFDDAPSRGLLIAALAAYGLASVVAFARRRDGGPTIPTATARGR